MKKVLVGGVFDVLHPGHEFFFQKAKEQGDYLVVVVASDKTARQKRVPVNNQAKRVENLRELGVADEVVAGGKGDFLEIVDKIRPEVVAFGHDQSSLMSRLIAELEERNIEIVQIKDVFEREMHSTTRMIEK